MLPYVPENIPISKLDYKRIIGLVGEANAKLSEYSGLLQGITNPTLLLSPLMNEEAVLSSRIEGTHATVEEVLEHDAGIPTLEEAKSQDIQEIANYRKAIRRTIETLNPESQISLLFIRQLHHVLMDSVRGADKNPGQFRTTQNWIGLPGRPIEEASFIPPRPLILQDCLANLESYINGNEFDPIVQAAVGHAQFEMIHPFSDGNGRVGRLLIPIQLYVKKRIAYPMFYLSAYLEKHRIEYNERLSAISRNSEWTEWIEFFLKAVIQQATDNQSRVRLIMNLFQEMRIRIPEVTRSQFAHLLVDALFDKPIFKKGDLEARGIPKQTVNVLINSVAAEGIIEILRPGSGRTPNIYMFPDLIKISR